MELKSKLLKKFLKKIKNLAKQKIFFFSKNKNYEKSQKKKLLQQNHKSETLKNIFESKQ